MSLLVPLPLPHVTRDRWPCDVPCFRLEEHPLRDSPARVSHRHPIPPEVASAGICHVVIVPDP